MQNSSPRTTYKYLGPISRVLVRGSGFTLAEIVVVIALMVILMIVGTGIYLSSGRFFRSSSGEILSVNATRNAADHVAEFARAATGAVASHTYNSVVYTAGSTIMIFKVPSVDSSRNIIGGSYDYVVFGRDPGNQSRLILITDAAPGSARPKRLLQITDKLGNISVTWDNSDWALVKNVSYVITVTQTGPNAGSGQVTGSVTFRN